MEILEYGQKIYTCEDCWCQFRLTSENDMKRDWTYRDYGFFLPNTKRAYFVYAKCPQCGNKVIIKWL
jgi:DNA-directed RNA polymerase subunit RPC12/RpoP